MKHVDFEGMTHHVGAPPEWKDTPSLSIESMAIRMTRQDDGVTICQSVWEFTEEERAAVAKGDNVVLSVIGGQPPVMLVVAPIHESKVIEVEAEVA